MNTLESAWEVDQAIVNEEERIVVIRFGSQSDPESRRCDKMMARVEALLREERVAVFYTVDVSKVNAFNITYALDDPCTLMFFHKNRPVPVDWGFGKCVKVVWGVYSEHELLEMVKRAYSSVIKANVLEA